MVLQGHPAATHASISPLRFIVPEVVVDREDLETSGEEAGDLGGRDEHHVVVMHLAPFVCEQVGGELQVLERGLDVPQPPLDRGAVDGRGSRGLVQFDVQGPQRGGRGEDRLEGRLGGVL
ncbi:hypothetical protein PG994_009189 [Apiospora phragmitis]|uniref:Uncharacterized protein n=1 Tax=Apiospora phragmitis TaxID=2905665 RepID=A0ABR1UIJ0_9PEZI